MPQCECLETCPVFNDDMKISSSLGAIYKERYCLGEYDTCARYTVYRTLGSSAVPRDLFPTMHEQAQELITKKR